jgi:hypothetical protein
MIEGAAQHDHVSVIGMRMGLEHRVRRPPDQLDIESRFRPVSRWSQSLARLCREFSSTASCPVLLQRWATRRPARSEIVAQGKTSREVASVAERARDETSALQTVKLAKADQATFQCRHLEHQFLSESTYSPNSGHRAASQ